MNNITPLPILAQVVGIIKNAISDLKIEYTSTSTATLKDGNDSIFIDQRFDSSGNFATVIINDQKEIIFSEDLLTVLQSGLQTATIVVNDLDIETRLVLETAKDAFDQLSSSYEFVKTTEKQLIKVKSEFKFETHRFEVSIINEANQLLVESKFSAKVDPVIQKIIDADTVKVKNALNGIFKKN